jgi:hypothetical protein
MWTQNKREDERLVDGESVSQIQSPLWEGFRRVHDFILKAVKGDQAAADAIFEDYLAGKLSEELLSNFAILGERRSSRLIQVRDRGGGSGAKTINRRAAGGIWSR